MRKFFAVFMIMGINHVPKICLHWPNNLMYSNDLIKKTINRDRFHLLLKCLNFSNNEDENSNYDRLKKIRRVVDMICLCFQQVLSPGKDVVIDETMILWRCRLLFHQYLPCQQKLVNIVWRFWRYAHLKHIPITYLYIAVKIILHCKMEALLKMLCYI